jgi:histidinol-phosphate aminotransferase
MFTALDEIGMVNDMIVELVASRKKLEESLLSLDVVLKVYPSDANFLLVKFNDAKKMYDYLLSLGIVVRDRSSQPLCENALRLTVGTEKQNLKLIESIKTFK